MRKSTETLVEVCIVSTTLFESVARPKVFGRNDIAGKLVDGSFEHLGGERAILHCESEHQLVGSRDVELRWLNSRVGL